MRPHADQLSLFDSREHLERGKTWKVGFFTPSGKLVQSFYLYHARDHRRAVDAKGRRRKFSTWNAARKAGDALEGIKQLAR